MEVNKGRSSTKSGGKKIVTFVGDVKQELKKVEWTSKEELKSYTKVVLASIFLFAMFVYFIDLGVQGILGVVHSIFRLIFG